MRYFLICLTLICFAITCFADDTIYCPKDAGEQEKQCRLAKEKIQEIKEILENWNPLVNDTNIILYKVNRFIGENNQQYAARMKTMISFHYQGRVYPVRGKFTKDGVTFIPLTHREAENILLLAFKSKRHVSMEMNNVKQNTNILKPMIRNKIVRLEKERQQHTLFLAQCCGYRWTNEGKPLVNGGSKPARDTDNGKGLLGEEAEEQKHGINKY